MACRDEGQKSSASRKANPEARHEAGEGILPGSGADRQSSRRSVRFTSHPPDPSGAPHAAGLPLEI